MLRITNIQVIAVADIAIGTTSGHLHDECQVQTREPQDFGKVEVADNVIVKGTTLGIKGLEI